MNRKPEVINSKLKNIAEDKFQSEIEPNSPGGFIQDGMSNNESLSESLNETVESQSDDENEQDIEENIEL
jgi:hypothetical protein